VDIDILRPTLLINKAICKRNIKNMVQKACRNKVQFRPHFKTHQSHEIGRWYRDEGVKAITVSSVNMAHYFAADGWNDITIAFPVNILEIDLINELANKVDLHLLVESAEIVKLLNDKLNYAINIYIKIDTGYNRSGIDPDNIEMIESVLDLIKQGTHTSFSGYLAHAGHSYACKKLEQIKLVHEDSMKKLQKLKSRYLNAYPNLMISVGDTPTCSTMEDFSWADEIRPGNFIFYDLTQVQIGSCIHNDIAVALACPVVAINKEKKELLIYGGGIHFSKEKLNTQYGQIVAFQNNTWSQPIDNAFVMKLSQEHGTISAPIDYIEKIKHGDLILALPIHSCMTANLMDSYLTTDGEILSKM